jgi:Tol biopolymer transport system component
MTNADGSGLVQITPPQLERAAYASWSPDGSKIAFQGYDPVLDRSDVYVMNSDGTGLANLTNAGECYRPEWSPDGGRIAFLRYPSYPQVYVMHSDGTGQRRLTHDDGRIRYGGLEWSPDGGKIAFTGQVDRQTDIYLANTDGSRLVNLTNHPEEDYGVTWSPTSSKR